MRSDVFARSLRESDRDRLARRRDARSLAHSRDEAVDRVRRTERRGPGGFAVSGSAAYEDRAPGVIAEDRDMAGAGLKPNTSLPPGPDADDRAYAAMIARAKALIPQLRDRASKTEDLRRLPKETERDLHEAGLFRILQ